MPGRSSLCPRCHERLPEEAAIPTMGTRPRCGEPVAGRGTRDLSAESLNASKARRALSTAFVAIVCLAGIAGCGAVVDRDVSGPSSSKGPAAPSVAAQGPASPDAASKKARAEKAKEEGPSWSHSRLIVVRPEQGADKGPVVVLGHPSGATDAGLRGIQRGLLARELIRQAVLLAARDEMGLATRDELLGDKAPEGKGSTSADFAWLPRLNGPASVRISRDAAEEEPLPDLDVLPAASIHDLVALARAAEGLSRTEFPRALRTMGLDGKPNVRRPEAALPDSVEPRLESLGMVEPLVAVRELHAAIRKDGESPARLGALVRGYANLGVLNEYLWSPAHQAFKARAFLYAQRLIAQEPESPWGLWHRAYIEAMAGLHKRALDDLDEARKLAGAKSAPKVPVWVDTLATYCRFDLAGLKKVGGSQAKFAALLRLIALEYPHHSDLVLHAAQELLSADPECFRVHEVMYNVGGVSNLHVATMFAPQVLTQAVPERIRAIGSLPDQVREPIERNAGEVALVDALERAGGPGEDAGEPSWAVLGSLIRETRFVHVQNRLDFMTHWWHVPVEEFWDEARPLVARHRFHPYLLTMAIGTPQADQAFADSFDPSWLPDLEYAEQPMINKLGPIAEAKRRQAWSLVQMHMDHLVRDFATQCDLYWKPNVADPSSSPQKELLIHNANKILMLSPENPFAMSILIECDWDAIQPRLAEWVKKHSDFLPLVGSLGRRYSRLKQYDKAREYLERFIAGSPEQWAFRRLAENCRDQGDTARWLATLDQFLAAGEDHGLEHAKVRVEVADYYMSKGQWEKAQPYAEAAAETWAGWAMRCAMRCYEGMKDWERAELWARRLSERYPDSSLRAWLNFCKRTGHGDIEAAKALVGQFVADAGEPAGPAAAGDRAQPAGPLQAGYASWLQGSTKEAMESMRKAYPSASPLLSGCALMVLADELGDAAQRDAVLAELCTKYRGRAPLMFDVLQMFRDAFARGDRELPDPKALALAVDQVKPNARGNTEFYVGWLLRKRGKRQDAESYLKRSVETKTTNAWLKRIAEDTLKRMNGDPVPAKDGEPAPR
ncbi:MAG: tetratricopeptide repeat protein [Isosphaeraceae bacterium]